MKSQLPIQHIFNPMANFNDYLDLIQNNERFMQLYLLHHNRCHNDILLVP